MSRPDQTTIECPACGREDTFTIWQSMNVTLDPRLKEELLSGELMTFTCRQCRQQAPVQYSFLYHDMKRRRMIWLITVGDEVSDTSNTLAFMHKMAKEPYTLRRVASLDELIEKVLIWDSGFDDRALELYKLGLHEQLAAEEQLVGPVFYTSAPDDRDVDGVLEFVVLAEDESTPISVPAQTYHEFEEQTADLFAAAGDDPVEWLRVDQEYARSLLGE